VKILPTRRSRWSRPGHDENRPDLADSGSLGLAPAAETILRTPAKSTLDIPVVDNATVPPTHLRQFANRIGVLLRLDS